MSKPIMYTHARQFPHLAGMQDAEIRAIASRAMSRYPHLLRVMKIRNRVVLVGLPVAIAAIAVFSDLRWNSGPLVRWSIALMAVGGSFSAFLLAWNLIWVNTVIFRITREEVARGET
jgi:hypothetical protein